MAKIRKGMVLAAGLGTRLLPVTEQLPKPLVPVLNVANILYSLSLLKRAGIQDVVLNLHHLPEKIEAFLQDGKKWGMRLSYSKEKQLLGTGGGLKNAEAFFGGEPLVLVNCDFISNVDLTPLLERHMERRALGTMLLYENPAVQPLYSKVGVTAQGHLCSLPRLQTAAPERTGIFTGIHILQPEAFSLLQAVPSGINEILYPTWMKQKPQSIYGDFIGDSFWYDTGERNTIFSASLQLLTQLKEGNPFLKSFLKDFGGYEEKQKGVWLPTEENLPTGVKFQGPVLVGKKCSFSANCSMGPSVVLGDGSKVGAGSSLTQWVGIGASEIPANQNRESALQYQETVLCKLG